MAFNCTTALQQGYRLASCSLSQGGVTTIYMAPWSGSTNLTYTLGADDTITSVGTNSGATLYTFDCVSETAEFNEKAVANIQNQSIYHEQTVEILIPTQSAALRNQYKALASSGVLLIVKDRQGVCHLIGKTQAAFLTEGSAGTGKAGGDFNGYKLIFTAKEPEPSFIVGSTAFTAAY